MPLGGIHVTVQSAYSLLCSAPHTLNTRIQGPDLSLVDSRKNITRKRRCRPSVSSGIITIVVIIVQFVSEVIPGIP